MDDAVYINRCIRISRAWHREAVRFASGGDWGGWYMAVGFEDLWSDLVQRPSAGPYR